MTYYITLTIPARFMDEGLADITNAHFNDNRSIEQIKNDLNVVIGNQPSGLLSIEDPDNETGKLDKFVTYLVDNGIPFDSHCSQTYDYGPDTTYFRPGMDEPKVVYHTAAGDDYLLADTIQELIIHMDSMTKEGVKQTLKQHLLDNTSQGVSPLTDFISETVLGSNKDAMKQIEEVLNRLDRGEIDTQESMRLIREIKEAVS